MNDFDSTRKDYWHLIEKGYQFKSIVTAAASITDPDFEEARKLYDWYIDYHRELMFFWYRLLNGVHEFLYHDFDKKTGLESDGYTTAFMYEHKYVGHTGDYTQQDRSIIRQAKVLHIARSEHHPEHWVYDGPDGLVISEMPVDTIKEMVADWSSFSIEYDEPTNITDWYDANKEDIKIHPKTREKAEYYISEIVRLQKEIRDA